MIAESNLPVSKACETLSIDKSTYYRWKYQDFSDLDINLKSVIQEVALEFPYYGYRRITKELHRRGIKINHKKILRIMREDNLLCLRRKSFKPITTQSNHNYKIYPNLVKDLVITKPNQAWVGDVTYIRLLHEFIYLAVIMDLFSRKCIGWNLSRNVDAELTLIALKRAISNRKHLSFQALIHHSDQGVQYASNNYIECLKKSGIKISMSSKGNAYDNAFAESFIKTLKHEEINMNEYSTFEDAYTNIKQFIEKVYNRKRLHSSIGYLPPDEYEKNMKRRI